MQIYLPIYEIIVDLHDAILETSGGRPGILNENVIHAAVARPKTFLSYHEDCDLHTVCAVLLDSLARNHAFVEGNKRTGLMTAILTYELNGIALNMSADRNKEYEELVLWVVLEKPEIVEIAERLKSLTQKYQSNVISKFVERLKSAVTIFGID
jgi:death-on-curing protein